MDLFEDFSPGLFCNAVKGCEKAFNALCVSIELWINFGFSRVEEDLQCDNSYRVSLRMIYDRAI